MPGAIHHDAAVAGATGHQPRDRVGDARIIDRVLAMRAAILHEIAAALQVTEKLVLQIEPAMIRTDSNLDIFPHLAVNFFSYSPDKIKR